MSCVFTLLLSSGCGDSISQKGASQEASNPGRVVYGTDNRLNLSNAQNPVLKKVARSTAAMISETKLSSKNGQTVIAARPLEMRERLCPGERFGTEPSVAACSGFLIADDLVVTAGHCIRAKRDCSAYKWVFDFNEDSITAADEASVSSQNVYGCKKVVESFLSHSDSNDYAVIQLDRKVKDRTPLDFRKTGKISDLTKIAVMGYPSGIPLKIADHAMIRENTNPVFFRASLDTFKGNSGSAVVDSQTGVVEGVLVRGEQDYQYDVNNKCYKTKVCAEDKCRSEDVTRITEVNSLYGKEPRLNGVFAPTPVPSPTPTPAPIVPPNTRYRWLPDGTCNEFRADQFVREVDRARCIKGIPAEYVWFAQDSTCNEFRGEAFIGEVDRSRCNKVTLNP